MSRVVRSFVHFASHPSYLIVGLRKLIPFLRLDPLNIGLRRAGRFFARLEGENKALIDCCIDEILASDVIFDIGSNCGFVSKMIIERGYNGKLVLFEPIANLLSNATRLLEHTTNEKHYVNAAVGEQDGRIELYIPIDSNIGWITALGEKTASSKKIEVSLIDPAKLIQVFRPSFVKIDVEGCEALVLPRFVEAIDADPSYRPSFLIELGWGVENPHWGKFLSLAEVLNGLGYKVFDLSADMAELGLDRLRELNRTTDVLVKRVNRESRA